MSTRFDKDYTGYQTNRSRLRKIVRRAYLHSAKSFLRGATLDFGCGAGELLARLPRGSKGLEYNKSTVDYCVRIGLDVDWYDGTADGWQLSVIPDERRFESMVISHVLEHFDSPMEVLAKLLRASRRIGVSRVLVIVPGRAGYQIDRTHRTFVDYEMLANLALTEESDFLLAKMRYFPGNSRILGDWFPHHELQALFARA